MSYIELNNVMFRGRLKGANGAMRLQLTGSHVAVDTLNVSHGAVTFSYLFSTANQTITTTWGAGLNGGFTITDSNTYLEITAYTSGSGTFLLAVDGIHQPERVNGARLTSNTMVYKRLLSLAPGVHNVSIVGTAGSVIHSATVLVRYIRRTGDENR